MNQQREYDIIVIGAGAAGILAAGRAAMKGARVILLEKKERAGRKLLITGKGRCNITNTASVADYLKKIHPDSRFLRQAFGEYFSDQIIELLEKQGVATVTERGGRVFPASSSSADVVNGLLNWIREMGVELRLNARVSRLSIVEGRISGVELTSGSATTFIPGKKVILCAGGHSYPATGSDGDGSRLAAKTGHKIIPALPALVPLESDHPGLDRLQGLSLKNVKAILWIGGKKQHEEFGEMLFTHFGVSGPIVLSLSRFASAALAQNEAVELSIDLKPALNEQQLDARLMRDLDSNGKKQLANIIKLWLPSTLADYFMYALSLDPGKEGHQVNSKERRKILLFMKEMRFRITGTRPFREAIITAGGVVCKDVNPKTMGSRLVEGLYFAGEVLDLDADTGGYNLQIAWSTGWLAGSSAAGAIKDPSE